MSKTADTHRVELEQFYHLHLQQQRGNAQRVGWKNEADQQIRFEQLTKVMMLPATGTVNDLGCGLGDFARFLQDNGFSGLVYVGYDTVAEMIQQAILLNRRDLPWRFVHIQRATDMLIADYTVASGIFNVKLGLAEEVWLSHVLGIIQQMDSKSRKGFAFNVLSTYPGPEARNADLYYADPLFLFDYCKRHFSSNVALLHDYSQNDFTILVRKT